MTIAAAIEPGQVAVPASVNGGASVKSGASVRVRGGESFRSGWQSLLASLGTGIDDACGPNSSKGEGGKGLDLPLAEIAGVAQAVPSSPAGGGTPLRMRNTGQTGISTTTARPANQANLPTVVPAGRAVPGPLQETVPAPKNAATTQPEEPAAETKQVLVDKSAKTVANAPVKRTKTSVPAQTEMLVAVATAQALNPAPSNASRTAPAVSPANVAGQESLDGLERAGLGTNALPFPCIDPLHSTRAAQVAISKEPASGQSAIGSTKNGIPAPKASHDEEMFLSKSITEIDLPAAIGVKYAPGFEPPAVSGEAQVLNRKGAGRDSAPQETMAVPAASDGLERSVPAAGTAERKASQPNAPSLIASEPGLSSSEHGSAPGAAHMAHPAGEGATIRKMSRLMEGQPATATQENSNPALAREMAVMRGGVTSCVNITTEQGSAAAAPATRDTFAALDAESASRTSTWIHADRHHAEAGFEDPALGWVSVRANAGGSGIHASLVPASADAALALGGHLAGLNAHLAEQHTPVETLTLVAPEGKGIDAGMGRDAGQNMQQGTGEGSESGRQPGTGTEVAALKPVIPREVRAPSSGLEPSYSSTRPGGTHISVVA